MDQQYTTALTAAISNFSPQHSLHTDEDFTRLYVQRPLAFIAELGEQIRQATPETKFLVYGHRGCGKTSELNRLARDLEDTHFTVILSLENENDPNDLHYTELLTSLCRSLLYSARERKLDVSERLLKDVEAWFATVEDISERKFSAEGATTEKVGLYFLELFSRQSAEFNKRQERRAKRQQHEGQLFALINRFITEIMQVDTARRGGSLRRLFAVVDSLDRYTPEIAREIFKYAPALQAPAMNIVYTVPLALTQDTAASNLLQDFGNFDCTIPIVTLFALDGARDEVAWTIAHEIIGKRCGGVRLPHDIDELLIEGSGGVLSILCWLFYNVYSLLLAREIAAT